MSYQSLLRQPYHLFFITGILFCCLSFLATNQDVEFDLNDTYVVVPMQSFILVIGILMSMLWLLYEFTNRLALSAHLVWIHFILTLGTLLAFAASVIYGNFTPRRYYNFSKTPELISSASLARITAIAVIIFIIAQIIYLVNITGGMISKRIKK